MRKIVVAAFCVILLLSLGLLVNAGIVSAAQEGYEFDHWQGLTEPTIDGQWTNDTEWEDVEMEYQMDGDLNVGFRTKWLMSSPTGTYSGIPVYWIIEFYDDNTEDAEDYWQIIYDGTGDGGSAPNTDDVKIKFVGHDQLGFTLYRGDGTQWVEDTDTILEWGLNIEIVDSISESPTNSTPHYIMELVVDHTILPSGPDQCVRVSAYDASNSDAGEQAYPESSEDVPDEWAQTWSQMEPIPEGLTFAVMVLLSSVSLIVGSQYLRKRSKKQ